MTEKIEINKKDNKKFTHLIHISDVHLRPNDRHDEFKKVFDQLYVQIEKLKQSGMKALIVLTGDILDNKTNLTSNSLDLCDDFFTRLESLYPTILILGNHDMRTLNYLDNLTIITKRRTRFHYLRDSGVYEFGDVFFIVNSLYGDTNNFITVNRLDEEQKKNKTIIMLYHGMVDGCINDAGLIIKNTDGNNRTRNKKDFELADATLLGDIHKTQSLTPTIWYAGSLLQQNFGESYRNHGFLIWDIRNKSNIKITFNEIINEYGFMNIYMENNKWINKDIEFPKKSSIRYHLSNTTELQANELGKLIEETKCTKIINIEYRHQDKILQFIKKDEDKENDEQTDIVLTELNLLKMDSDKLKKINDLHKKYMETITLEDNKCAYLWTPISLEFKNIFGYSGDYVNKIDFKDGITSITAPNKTGKTSIINILFFVIFGELLINPGKSKNVDILNNSSKKGYINLVLQYGTKEYTIRRELTKGNKSNSTGSNDRSLTYIDNNKPIIVKSTEADKILKSMFGDIDDFYKCNVVNTRDQYNDFFWLSDGDKIKYLKQIFKLDYFNTLVDKNKENINEKDTLIKELKIKYEIISKNILTIMEQYNTKTIDELKNLLIPLRENNNKIKLNNNNINLEINKNNNVLIAKEKQKHIIKNTNLEELQKELEIISQKYNYYMESNDINTLKSQLFYYEKLINKSVKENKNNLEKKIENIKTIMNSMKNINNNINQNDLIKSIAKCENENIHFSKEINNIIAKMQKYKLTNIKIDKDKSMDDLVAENILLQKQIINISEPNKSLLLTRNDLIKSEINKLNKLIKQDQNITNNEIIIKKANLQQDINKTNIELKRLSQEIKKLKKVYEPCIIPITEIPQHIKSLNNKKKNIIVISEKIKYDNKQHIINVNEYTIINEELIELLTKSISDIDITNYINIIDIIYQKTSLNEHEYTDIKGNLLKPLKELLDNIKQNNLLDYREKINQLNNKKILLQDEISKINDIIKHNNIIEEQIKENLKIEDNNNNINVQILNYEYHYKISEINILKDTKFKMENDLKVLENKQKYIQLDQEWNENIKIIENIDYNDNIINKISTNEIIISTLQYNNLNNELKIKQNEKKSNDQKLEILREQEKYMYLLKELNLINEKIIIADKNEKICNEITSINNKINYEVNRKRYNEINDEISKLLVNIDLDKDIILLKMLILNLNNQLEENRQLLKNNEITQATILHDINSVSQYQKEMSNIHKYLTDIDAELVIYKEYQNIISPKNLQVKILRNKLRSMEEYINKILIKYTDYKIEIEYNIEDNELKDKKLKTNESKIAVKALNKNNDKLALERLSTYEMMILSTAWKRGMIKHTTYTHGSIYIMDESLECMDATNFEHILPDLLKMIVEEYRMVLIISQRDISGLAEHEIQIEKTNGIGKIIQKNKI